MKIDFLKKEIWDLMRTIQVSKDMVMCPVAKDYPITPLQLRILMEVNVSEKSITQPFGEGDGYEQRQRLHPLQKIGTARLPDAGTARG